MASANNSKQTVAVIGAGMTGITCARALYVAGYDVTVFEKSRGLGGRMATRRVGKTLTIDHEAQFITARSDAFKSFMQRACKAGTAEIWQPTVDEDEEAVDEELVADEGAADEGAVRVSFRALVAGPVNVVTSETVPCGAARFWDAWRVCWCAFLRS